jgi:hypothetical protein
MNVMKPDSFLNVSEMESDKAVAAMTSTILSAILTTEMENKTKSVQLVSLTGDVLEFFSAIPGENTTTPKGPKLSKDEVIELLGNDEILSAVYDHIVAEYPEISVTKAPGKTGVFFFCPRLVMLVHEYQSNELLSLAEQLSKPLN